MSDDEYLSEKLGDEDQPGWAKQTYFVFMFGALALLFYGLIGAGQGTSTYWTILFYIAFGTVLGIIPLIWDSITKGREDIESIDTITVEEPRKDWLGYKVQIIIGLMIGAFILFRVSTTGSAIVGSPEFGIFDSALGNAVLSGTVGILENWVFFGFFFPSLYAYINLRSNAAPLALFAAIILTTLFFLGYHGFRYGSNQEALLSVAFFGFINCIITFAFRSLIITDIFHFNNNVGATIFGAQRISLQFGGG